MRPGVGLLWSSCLAMAAATVPAQVASVEVEAREVVAGGEAFGETGPYERLEGRLELALDPADPRNARIVDLQLAPTDDQGRVRARANFEVLQPVDPARRGTALLEVSNRGGRAALRYFNRAGRRGFGDGLLMRLGLTVIRVGWQLDVPSREGALRLEVPRVEGVTGPVRADWVVDDPADTLPLGHRGHEPYPVIDPGGDGHRLTVRDGRDAPRRAVPRAEWRFTEDRRAITMAGGFQPGHVYELVYHAGPAAVVGMGLAAIRDTASFAKHDEACPFPVRRVVAVGISQTGRFLRHLLYQGFVTDTQGRQAMDGMVVLTAGAGRGSFNHRFAQPSRDAHRYSAFFYPTDLFPFTSRLQEDPVTGRMDGLFARQHDPDHLPKVFWVNTGYEYWGRAAALIHVTVDGERDLPPTARERIYHISGAQHYPGGMPRVGDDTMPNAIDLLAPYRALLAAMVQWVEDGTPPPPSRYPKLADGTLAPLGELRDPDVGVVVPSVAHAAYRADYGPRWSEGIVTRQPPALGPTFPVLLPQRDARGNELGGLRTWELRAPLAAYFPWRLREDGELRDFVGFAVPFEDALRKELYGGREEYLAAVRAACAEMVAERTMLADDVELALGRAGRLWDWCDAR